MAARCPEYLETEFIADCATHSVEQLAEKYDRAFSTIKEWRLDLYRRGRLLWWPGIRLGDCLVYDDHVEIAGDAIIVADLEVPHHDAELLGYVVAIAKKFGIKTLVVAGDFLANDAVGYFSSRREDTDASLTYRLSDSLEDGQAVLRALFEWFDEIIIIKGNHEQRGTRSAELGFFRMMQNSWGDLGDLQLSYYKWMVLRSGDQEYRIEHLANYSKVPGAAVRERAEIENSHVVAAHTHHYSFTVTRDGRHVAIDLGHCTRPETRYYKQVNGTSRHPKWVAGFWMIRNGYPYGFPKDFTDWGFWLKELEAQPAENTKKRGVFRWMR